MENFSSISALIQILTKVALLCLLLRSASCNLSYQPTITANECDCSDYYYDHGSPPYHHLGCENLTTEEEVYCFQDLILNAQNISTPDTAMHISIYSSDIGLFPNDFFKPYNVTSLELNTCNLLDIPFGLINPICDKLKRLIITINEVTTIPSNGFLNCSELFSLNLDSNLISTINPNSFSGLPELAKLILDNNELKTLSKIDGLENIREISFHDNLISVVDINAFEGMTRLKTLQLTNNSISVLEDGTFDSLESSNPTIYLEGNPFFCNCSLQWLQDWLNEYGTSDDPYCVAPVEGPLKTTDFC